MVQCARGNYRNPKRTRLTFREKALRQLENPSPIHDGCCPVPPTEKTPGAPCCHSSLRPDSTHSNVQIPRSIEAFFNSHYRDNVLSGRTRDISMTSFKCPKPSSTLSSILSRIIQFLPDDGRNHSSELNSNSRSQGCSPSFHARWIPVLVQRPWSTNGDSVGSVVRYTR
jgi:hypothetical protein